MSMANVVVRSAQSLSLAEKRILIAGIAKLRGKNETVTLSALEYAETYDVSLNTAYTQLKVLLKISLIGTCSFKRMTANLKVLPVFVGLMATNILMQRVT